MILGLVEIGGVYNLFRRIYQYVEEICKEILFIGCFILRRYLQAFVLSTKKCADDESCDPPEDSPVQCAYYTQGTIKPQGIIFQAPTEDCNEKIIGNLSRPKNFLLSCKDLLVIIGGGKDFFAKNMCQ